MSERETIPFSIRGPIPVQCTTEGEKGKKIGCSVIDLFFNQPSQLGELVFSNFYTAFISIYIKRKANNKNPLQAKDSGSGTHNTTQTLSQNSLSSPSPEHGEWGINGGQGTRSRKQTMGMGAHNTVRGYPGRNGGTIIPLLEGADCPWECSVYMKTLMRLPHFEEGSQDRFFIPATESLVEWRDVIIMRLLIHQPSSVWKQFTIDGINVFRNMSKHDAASNQPEDFNRQTDGWLTMLKGNTKRMLNGYLIEPEPEKQERRKNSN